MNNILRPALVLALALTAACGDSPTDVTPEVGSGSLSFTYSSTNSPLSGTFSAEGALPSNPQSGVWAAGAVEGNDAAVMGYRNAGGAESTAILDLPDVTLGTVQVSEDCEGDGCANLAFLLEASVGGDAREYLCAMEAGSITVATLTDSRIKGTFSGTGHCFTLDEPNDPVIEFTNGTFDTPLVSGGLGGSL